MMYKKYKFLFNKEHLSTGFSKRFPDYAEKYKLSLLEAVIKNCKKDIFLDLGAGSGRLSAVLINNVFKNGIAIEVSPDKQIWSSLLKKHKNLSLIDGLLQNKLPVLIKKKIKIDLIILSELFEHIPFKDLDSFLQNLHQIISNDGKIYLTTPNSIVQGPAEKSVRWYKKQAFGHHKHYNLKELYEIFSKYNFQIDWHKFESTKIKRNIYNRLFYPISRLDQKLLFSSKLPIFIRIIYRYSSIPIILLFKSYFWLIGQLIYLYEKKNNSERISETIVLQISKKQNL